jgi:hypothetical protein
MNIFIDSKQMSRTDFDIVRSCLAVHQTDLNKAILQLHDDFHELYAPLRLGGMDYGLPPFNDHSYMAALSRMRGATVIPPYGYFVLYPGGAARGTINGHSVRLIASGQTHPGIKLEVDGKLVTPTTNWKTNVSDVTWGSGWFFDGPICTQWSAHCGGMIDIVRQDSDRSELLDVNVRIADHTYGGTSPDWAAKRPDRAASRPGLP